jgi:hypothetical protein
MEKNPDVAAEKAAIFWEYELGGREAKEFCKDKRIPMKQFRKIYFWAKMRLSRGKSVP